MNLTLIEIHQRMVAPGLEVPDRIELYLVPVALIQVWRDPETRPGKLEGASRVVLRLDPDQVYPAEVSPVPWKYDPPWHRWKDPGLKLRVQVVSAPYQVPGVPWSGYCFRAALP